MTTPTPAAVATIARELQGYAVPEDRLAELGAELATVLRDLDQAREHLPFEAEPADMRRTMRELAAR